MDFQFATDNYNTQRCPPPLPKEEVLRRRRHRSSSSTTSIQHLNDEKFNFFPIEYTIKYLLYEPNYCRFSDTLHYFIPPRVPIDYLDKNLKLMNFTLSRAHGIDYSYVYNAYYQNYDIKKMNFSSENIMREQLIDFNAVLVCHNDAKKIRYLQKMFNFSNTNFPIVYDANFDESYECGIHKFQRKNTKRCSFAHVEQMFSTFYNNV